MNEINEEEKLIRIAESHPCGKTSAEAMSHLRSKYDETYGWCIDCDGLVCKKKDCCLNR